MAADALDNHIQGHQVVPALQHNDIGVLAAAQMSDKGVAYRIPQSEFLVALVEELFQKPVNQVSYEEINSIVYLETWNPEGTDAMQVSVMLADGTEEGYKMHLSLFSLILL